MKNAIKATKMCLVIVALLMLSSSICLAATHSKIMKIGFVAARNTAQAKAMYKFAELVEQKTKGSIKGELFPESQLGGIREMIEATQMNVCQVYFGGAGDMAPFSPRFNLVEMHMLVPHNTWDDYAAGDAIFNSPIAQEILKDLEKVGLKGLSYWDNGYKHVLNAKRPFVKLEDLRSLKIRSIENQAQVAALKSWGALPVIIPFAEVFTSLNQGLIDGLENQIGNIINSNFYEASKHLTLSGFLYLKAPVVMSKTFYDSLTETEKKAIQEAAKEGAAYAREYLIQEEKHGIEFLRSKGVKVVEELDPKELLKMRALLRTMYDANVKKYDPKGGVEFMKVVDEAWGTWEKRNIK